MCMCVCPVSASVAIWVNAQTHMYSTYAHAPSYEYSMRTHEPVSDYEMTHVCFSLTCGAEL